MRLILSFLWFLSCWVIHVKAFAPRSTTRGVTCCRRQPLAAPNGRLRIAISPNTHVTPPPAATTVSTITSRNKADTSIPFIIEELPRQRSHDNKIFHEISRMCIAAFFNDGAAGQKIPFYKEWQLTYLRNLQQSDLKRRRKLFPQTNMMFVARRVLPATATTARQTPLILDLSQIYNFNEKSSSLLPQGGQGDYYRGEIIGFVEVTLRPYGLGEQQQQQQHALGLDEESKRKMQKRGIFTDLERPILTNLSVKYEARKSGVGGRLLEQCERLVQSRWNRQEIVLEVEDDNDNALHFYAKRGYKILFEDPASRRYDTNGLILRQLRCRRKVLRKSLSSSLMPSMEFPPAVNSSFVGMAWQRIKDSVKL